MKLLYILIIVFLTSSVNGQLIYKNGSLGTGTVTKSGVAAPAGTQWSELQNETGSSYSNAEFGFSASIDDAANKDNLSDNFTVPTGQTWTVSTISIYVFQQGNTSATSPFNSLVMQLWRGDNVNAPFDYELITGNLSTNRLVLAIDSLTYRIANTTVPSPGVAPVTTRKIWKLTASLPATLTAGKYYIVWGIGTSNQQGSLCPAATVLNKRTLPAWDGFAFNPPTFRFWLNAYDYGTPLVSGNGVIQDFPFEITYLNAGALPVKLESFTAQAKEKAVELNWTSLSEQNNKGYEIERSNDGQNFLKIGFVQCEGNSSLRKTYSWQDNTAFVNQKYYYRLKQLENDGQYEYSKIIAASLKNAAISPRLFSNIVRSNLVLYFESTEASKAEITIISMSGQAVETPLQRQLQMGISQLTIPVTNLAKGKYFITIKTKDTKQSIAFIKQ